MNLDPIRRLLDREAAEGRQLSVWWRDDDAVAATPALDRLLGLARREGVPIAIAAIPARLDASLPARLREDPGNRLLVHGRAHMNHAAQGRKSAEFGDDRPLEILMGEAASALATIQAAAGEIALPVFVPPWNRIAPDLPDILPGLGYGGLSTFGRARPVRGLQVVNTHLDPVDWRGSRSALDPEHLANALRLAVASSSGEAVGLLTHHLMFDEPLWSLTAALVALLAGHPAIRWPPLDALWAAELRH